MTGNRSGRAFMLTAGHCSTDFWEVADGTGIGPTSTNYWVPRWSRGHHSVFSSADRLRRVCFKYKSDDGALT